MFQAFYGIIHNLCRNICINRGKQNFPQSLMNFAKIKTDRTVDKCSHVMIRLLFRLFQTKFCWLSMFASKQFCSRHEKKFEHLIFSLQKTFHISNGVEIDWKQKTRLAEIFLLLTFAYHSTALVTVFVFCFLQEGKGTSQISLCKNFKKSCLDQSLNSITFCFM